MRAAAFAWEGLEPQERRRRIREYLLRQAESASLDPEAFAAAVAKALPGESGPAADASPSPRPEARLRDDLPSDPVDRIIALTEALSPVDRRRLIERMRALDMLPPVAPTVVVQRPVEPAPAPAPAPSVPPPAVAARSSGGASLSDGAFLTLAAAFGVQSGGRRGAPMSIEEVEAALAKQGVKRSLLTVDTLATALGHLAKGVASMSEEGEQNAHGLPEAIRTVLPNSRRAPVEELKNYLAGVRDADRLHDYIDEYFEPYRQLSRRLPDLCRRIKALADKLSPKDFEKNPPKSWSGVAYDKLWEQYRERFASYERQGFGNSEESTRAWLLRQWLN